MTAAKVALEAIELGASVLPAPAAAAVTAAANLIGTILDQHDAWAAIEEHRQKLAARAEAQAAWEAQQGKTELPPASR